MTYLTVALDEHTAAFYQCVASAAGQTIEQVLSDALFKLAGELSLEALRKRKKEPHILP